MGGGRGAARRAGPAPRRPGAHPEVRDARRAPWPGPRVPAAPRPRGRRAAVERLEDHRAGDPLAALEDRAALAVAGRDAVLGEGSAGHRDLLAPDDELELQR